MWQSVEILNIFDTLTLKQLFWKTKTFFNNWSIIFWLKALRLETHFFHTKLPYQKPMLRQIEWWVQNGPVTKEQSFTSNYFIFLKNLFQLKKEPLIKSWFDVLMTRTPYSYFVSAGVLFGGAFSLWVSFIVSSSHILNSFLIDVKNQL